MRAPFSSDTTDMTSEDQNNTIESDEVRSMDETHAEVETLGKKDSNKTAAVFGICLDRLMMKSPKMMVPFVLSRLCCYIEKYGLYQESLFRDGEEIKSVEHLKLMFNESGDAPLESAADVPSASKLLKLFFEELPEPLIPPSVQSDFVDDMEKLVRCSSDCVGHLKHLVDELPDSAFCVLKYLSRFLLRVANHHKVNGMNCTNLGVIFGPILFRPAKEDPLLYIIIKNITHSFVSDYYSIFEGDAELSSTEDSVSATSKPIFALHSTISRRQVVLYPSSVMPLIPMQPLRVMIPPVDTVLQDDEHPTDNDISVPILLIESQMEKLEEKSIVKAISLEDNERIGDKNATRKRKERRPSNEELHRSSSEERPSPVSDELLEKKEFIRRCSSHEEVKELPKQAFGIGYEKDFVSILSLGSNKNTLPIGPYFKEQFQPSDCDADHSPRPPNPKRRELDSSDNEQSEFERQKECAEYQNSCRSYSSGLRSWLSASQFSNSVSNKEASLKEQNVNLDLMLQNREKLMTDVLEIELDSGMDCSSIEFENCSADVDVPSCIKSNLPRSASCPIPKKDDDSCSDSENGTLSLSWNMLFESDDNEPVRSEHRSSWPLLKGVQGADALLSPSVHNLRKSNSYEAPLSPSAYRSYLSYRSSHLDSSVPPSPPVEQEDFGKSPVKEDVASSSVKELTKKIHVLKKKIRRFDERHEAEYGYRPSHAEKTNFPEAKKLMSDLYNARKELKALKEELHLHPSSTSNWHPASEVHILEDTTNCFKDESGIHKDFNAKPKPSLQSSWGETLKSLEDERKTANRPELIEDMTKEQVHDEKVAIQRALLHFESIHGKPSKKTDRNTIRPLYDRYRNVKHLLVKPTSFTNAAIKAKDTCSELQPIIEHETMDFTSPQHIRKLDAEFSEGDEATNMINEKSAPVDVESEQDDLTHGNSLHFQFLDNKYNNSNLHELPLSDMIIQQQHARSEKRRLRKILKEFEIEFQRLNGRKVQKEDKAPVEALYAEYKHVKARLRLLEALVSKHDEHQLT